MSTSSLRPVIAVVGATGQQGGAVLRALASSNEFDIRAITRNLESDSAKQLRNLANVELVAGDLDDEKSLVKVFTGAWGVFLVTNFWEPKVGVREEQQAKHAADHALKAGVKFFAFSSLFDAHELSGGKHSPQHFTLKNKAEQYIRSLPFPDGIAFPYAGFYASNFLTHMKPKKNEADGVYEFVYPMRSDVTVPFVDLEEEFGSAVLEIFRHPQKYNKQTVLTGTYLTLPQVAAAFSKGTGKAARYVQLPAETGRSFGNEYYDMLQFFDHFGYYGGINFQQIGKPTDAVAFFAKNAKQF